MNPITKVTRRAWEMTQLWKRKSFDAAPSAVEYLNAIDALVDLSGLHFDEARNLVEDSQTHDIAISKVVGVMAKQAEA